MKKRLCSILLILTCAISLIACDTKGKEEDSSFKFSEEEQGTIKENKYIATDGKFVMDVPENWKVQDMSGTTIITAPDYPENSDNITIIVSEDSSEFDSLTKEAFEEYYATLFTDFKLNTYEDIEIDGEKAISVSYVFSVSDVSMTQYQYFIQGDSVYTLTFTDASGEFKDDVTVSVDSIDLR